jgi:hypothetical protein
MSTQGLTHLGGSTRQSTLRKKLRGIGRVSNALHERSCTCGAATVSTGQQVALQHYHPSDHCVGPTGVACFTC